MKKINFKFTALATLVLGTVFFIACSNESEDKILSKQNYKSSLNDSITQSYDIVYEQEDRLLKVLLVKEKNDFQNTFSYVNTTNNQEIFNLNYSFNNQEENWKYREQNKTLEFANELKLLNIAQSELETLNYMLDEGFSELFYIVEENRYNQELYSILAYLKSATASNLRMLQQNSNVITGTMSPSFLVGKTFFIFQEDFIVDLESLRNDISSLEEIASQSNLIQDADIVDYIANSTDSFTTFDELYSFYIPLEEFDEHIDYMASPLTAGDCSENCAIGCGTDWGCCGSYTGCCYYSSLFCYWHDKACTNCDKWHCGPDCKPDVVPNRPVKVFQAVI